MTTPHEPLPRWQRFTGTVILCLSGGLLSGVSGTGTDAFETVPDHSPPELLPATMVSGTNFHVVDPVHGDGLMNRFVLESHFGKYDAYGRTALAIRIQEVAALTTLSKVSDVDLVAGGMARGVETQVGTAVTVVTHPVGTVVGIPKGIAHLFQGYSAKGQEALAEAQSTVKSSGGGGGGGGGSSVDVKKGEAAARHYAERYLGVTSAERGWYERLGVNPYTDNQLLRDAIRRAAKTEAVGSFGVKFAGLPALPGIELTQRAVDAIYHEDPAAVRARTRKTLAGYGLSAGEIESWLNAPLLNPARQVLLLSVAERLNGVAGRAELFRHSLGLTSNEEVQVYLLSAELLVKAHASHPLAEIIADVRLPAAQRPDGRQVVCGAFEAVYWTESVARAETELQSALPPLPQDAVRELWLMGTISDRARTEAQQRGWELHEVPQSPSAETPARKRA